MSITLMAYPMAFLIAPEEVKDEGIRIKNAEKDNNNKNVATKNLKFIKVLTNIKHGELSPLLSEIGAFELYPNHYYINTTKLDIQTEIVGKYTTFTVFGTENSTILQTSAEALFTDLDRITNRNVRLLGSQETFYYNYTTDYASVKDIYSNLKQENATQIFTTQNDEVVANLNGQSIRYYKSPDFSNYMLEVEQKVTIMNIGMTDETGQYASYGLTNLKIQTNIKKDELRPLLKAAKYGFYEANGQTPLRNSYATLNWVENDGFYVAEFSGQNNTAITKEAEIIFRKMNIAAGRDLRKVNDVFTTVYTYNTNYTDKGVLINTLYEHGATEISENDDVVTCKLFNMEMKYYRQESGAYSLDITQITNESQCQDVINDLNEEYGLNIQEVTYNKIKERLQQENLQLESETVLDDNSIVLTIEI